MRSAVVAMLVALSAGVAVGQEDRSPAALNATAVVGAPTGRPISGEALDAATRDVASLLRCPVCQGLSIWDSPATMAVNMKHEVRELLARGFDRDQVVRYFEHSYGEFVLLAPRQHGVDGLVWTLPVVLFVSGAFIVGRVLARGAAASKKASPRPSA